MDLIPRLVGVVVIILGLRLSQRRGWIDMSGPKVRRGTGHAMLGLQEFIEPSVEHIFAAGNAEQKEKDDIDADEGDPEPFREDLAESLRRSPIDPEEVHRHLTAAARGRGRIGGRCTTTRCGPRCGSGCTGTRRSRRRGELPLAPEWGSGGRARKEPHTSRGGAFDGAHSAAVSAGSAGAPVYGPTGRRPQRP